MFSRTGREPRASQRRWSGPGAVWLLVACGLALLAVLNLWRREPAGDIRGEARVIDGDSLRVAGRELRLKGIDAPEARQICRRNGEDWACGEAATDRLRELTWRRETVCRVVETDTYARGLAFCAVEGRDINAQLVRDGLAVAYGHFAEEEAAARVARRGLWAGTFEGPADWRRRHPRQP